MANEPSQDRSAEMVHHPEHYASEKGMECWDAIEAATCYLTGVEAFDTGCIIKYAWRWKQKNGVEDLRKLIEYAKHLIQLQEEDHESVRSV